MQHPRTMPRQQNTQHELTIQHVTHDQPATTSAASIVVGADGSRASDAAVEWAAHEAELKHTGLLLVQARPKRPGDTERTHDQASWRPMPGRLTTRIAERFGISVERVVRQGAVLDTLAAAAEGAQLLVVGQSDAESLEPVRLQPLGSRCAQVVSCPVVTVPLRFGATPVPGPGRTGLVVVGLDSSPESWAALNWAITEARVRRCACKVVHVTDSGETASGNDLHARRTALALVDRAIEYAAYCGVEAHGQLLTGVPASALLDAAGNADLLVLGGRFRSKADRLVHRDVAARCVRTSACPVVVVTTHHVDLTQRNEHPAHKGVSGSSGRRGIRLWAENWPIELPC